MGKGSPVTFIYSIAFCSAIKRKIKCLLRYSFLKSKQGQTFVNNKKKEEIYWCNFKFTLAEVTGLFLWSYCLSPARAEHLNPLQSKQSASLHEFLSNSPSYGLRIEGTLKCLASSRAGTTSNYFHESLNWKIFKKNHTELICSQKIKDITYHSTFFFFCSCNYFGRIM